MSQVKSVILADNRPANLPAPENIVQLCRDAGYDVRGIPIIDESRRAASAWVKYGWSESVTMGEALTQDWVGQVLNARPDAAVRIPKAYHAFEHGSFGYIVMEYIDGLACDKSDALQVAQSAAVECLIRVTGPTTAPGPVGGGPITHRFFVEWRSSVTYSTVQALEKHVNGVRMYRSFHPPCSLGGMRDSRKHGRSPTSQFRWRNSRWPTPLSLRHKSYQLQESSPG
jgi:hypothetical protein